MPRKIKKRSKKEISVRIVLFLKRFFIQTTIIIFLVLAFGFFELGRYTVYSSHPELYAQDRAAQTLQKVSVLINLPKGKPTMAVINDATLVKKTHPFFVNANNGDVLIVYQNAGEAILYRPSTNKLISVGSIYKLRGGSSKDTQKTHVNTSTIQSKSASTRKQSQRATTSITSK